MAGGGMAGRRGFFRVKGMAKTQTPSLRVCKVVTFEGASGEVRLTEHGEYAGLFVLTVDGMHCAEFNVDDLHNLAEAIEVLFCK